MMRTTIVIDDDVIDAAKSLGRATGLSLGQAVSALARRGLRARTGQRTRNGLPVFEVGPDAKIIPGDRAAELLDDDRQ